MRRGFGMVWALLSLLVVGVTAWFAYNAGLAQGLAATTVGREGAPYYGGYYPHFFGFGFGFLPLLFLILLAVFLFRRPWGHRHWGGYGGYGKGHDGSHELPPPIEERMQAWHQRAHRDAPPEADSGTTGDRRPQ